MTTEMSSEQDTQSYKGLRDELSSIPSSSDDKEGTGHLLQLLDLVIAGTERSNTQDEAIETEGGGKEDGVEPGPSPEDQLWEQFGEHREGSGVRTAINRWAADHFEDFLGLCQRRFTRPEARLDTLISVLSAMLSVPYVPGTPAADTLMSRFIAHSFLMEVIRSLIYDTSNAMFPIALRLIIAGLPYSPLKLTQHIPLVMIVLGRAVCWRDRPFVDADSPKRDAVTRTPAPNPAEDWAVAEDKLYPERTSAFALLPKQVVRLWLVALYSGWPSNVLAFIRDPVSYLQGKNIAQLYAVEWDDVWPDKLLAHRTGPVLNDFALHPSLIYFTSAAELADDRRWDKFDPSEYIASSHRVAHSELLAGDMFGFIDEPKAKERDHSAPQASDHVEADEGKTAELERPVAASTEPEGQDSDVRRLERENEILRMEAKFGDRVRKQMLFHIGRLHKNSLRFNSDEAEIHSFVNRLKEQSKTIAALSADLQTQREEASAAKRKHTSWQEDLRRKNDAFRAERKQWQSDAGKLRQDMQELEATNRRQKDELAMVKNERFKLQNELIALKPAVQRIEDYETRINQLTEAQRLWDDDIRKCKDARDDAERWKSRCYQLDQLLRVRDKEMREQWEKIRTLEVTVSRPPTPPPTRKPDLRVIETPSLSAAMAASDVQRKRADKLERENLEMQVELEKLRRRLDERARIVEDDKAFIWGKRSDSPTMFPV